MGILAILLIASIGAPIASSASVCSTIETLEFDGQRANESVTTQVEFGPRLPGSNASMELREWFMDTRPEFDWSLDPHFRDGYNLTNLEGRLIPDDAEENGPIIVLAAHYDSRNRAERDPDPNMTDVPIPGANDGGSGVAVLWELARILPSMELEHEVWILLTDAEDQGLIEEPSTWALGAQSWAENRSEDDISRIDAFLLVDMIGDSDLKIYRTFPPYLNDVEGNRLWGAVENLSGPLGLVDNITDCNGNPGLDIVNFSKNDGVIDDHVPMLNVGIPAIDFIDIRYGENATAWQGYWHTHEDTPDKVSAESLAHIGRLIELGLRQGSWLDTVQNQTETPSPNVEDHPSTFSPLVTGTIFALIALILLTFLGLHESVRLKR
jgi:glutaminyl-peptide cyclotransferase|tara:strand:- start:949 stop:2091 length:1143 start_codon:yes stop_codon:yes gene_type:complete